MCLLSGAPVTAEHHRAFGDYASFHGNSKYKQVAEELRRTSSPFSCRAYSSIVRGTKSLAQWRDICKRRDIDSEDLQLCANIEEVGRLLFIGFLGSDRGSE